MTHNFNTDEMSDSLLQKIEEKSPSSKKEKEKLTACIIWAMQFLNTLIIPVIATLLVYLYYKNKLNYVADITKQALNFSFSIILYFTTSLAFLIGAIYIELDFINLIFIVFSLVISTTAGILYFISPILGIINALKLKVFKPRFIIRFIK